MSTPLTRIVMGRTWERRSTYPAWIGGPNGSGKSLVPLSLLHIRVRGFVSRHLSVLRVCWKARCKPITESMTSFSSRCQLGEKHWKTRKSRTHLATSAARLSIKVWAANLLCSRGILLEPVVPRSFLTSGDGRAAVVGRVPVSNVKVNENQRLAPNVNENLAMRAVVGP